MFANSVQLYLSKLAKQHDRQVAVESSRDTQASCVVPSDLYTLACSHISMCVGNNMFLYLTITWQSIRAHISDGKLWLNSQHREKVYSQR